MSIVWLLVKIGIYTVILHVLFRQTYHFIFLQAKRPTIWIVVVALLSVVNMGLAYALSWDPRLVGSAVLTAIILNIAPPVPEGLPKAEFRATVDESYEGEGIAHGRLKRRLGLIAFAMFSLGAHTFFFR